MTMATYPSWSARRSARVASGPPRYTVIPGLEPIRGPEGLRLDVAPSPPPPERRAGRPEQRVSRDQLARVERRLTDRDRAILAGLATHHFLTTAQLQRW